MPIKKVYRKKKGAKRPYKKRGLRKVKDVPDLASLSVKETIVAPGGGTFQPNTLYNLLNTQLIDYARAVQVAQAYQHYRIKKIAVTFKPLYDTFMGAAGNMTKPNLYYLIDKSGAIPTNTTLEAMKSMGCKPKQLDEKNFTVSWRPSVLESAMFIGGAPGTGAPAKYKISPWLSTNANNSNPGLWVASGIDHLGLHWYMDQVISTGYAYTCEVEVQFQFKKPLLPLLSSVEGLPAQHAVKNNSPDGIVGGADGI